MATPWLVVSVRPVESTRTRSRGPAVGFCPMFGAPLPTLSDPLSSVTVLAPTIGSAGLTDAPSGGASAASGSYSAALFGLKGKADARSCVPAAFSARMSPAPDAPGSAGPLTVARLFRTVLALLLFLAGFAGRDCFAMEGSLCVPVVQGFDVNNDPNISTLRAGEVAGRGFMAGVMDEQIRRR